MKKTTLVLLINLFCIHFLSAQITFKQAKDSLDVMEENILSVLETNSSSLSDNIELSALKNLRKLDSIKKVIPDFNIIARDNLTPEFKYEFDRIVILYNSFIDDIGKKIRRELLITEQLRELFGILEAEDYENDITKDIYNPINFTKILHRKPAENGVAASNTLFNRASRHFIKREGTLHLEFDKKFVRYLTFANKLNIRVKAFIQRKDKSIKPISVLGLTKVETTESSGQAKVLNNDTNIPLTIEDTYIVTYRDSGLESISAEIAVPFEEVSIDDTVIVEITNRAVNGVGFISKFVFADYGWSQGPTGGFTFVQTIDGDDNIYRAAGSAGYSFRYNPKPSAKFRNHFFSPSFGPELNVLQKDDETLMGLGVFISTAANAVKIGGGFYLNGESNKAYVAIGLNFIEGYNKISELLNRVQ